MGTGMAWTLLILSGLLDVAWAISVKMTDGYSRLSWSILSFILLAAFIWALGKALQARRSELPMPSGPALARSDRSSLAFASSTSPRLWSAFSGSPSP